MKPPRLVRQPDPVLQMQGIRVSYGSTAALQGADFSLDRGEIHALVGAHRAGKSTLVKLLSGAVRKDGGEIVFDGRRVEAFTPRSAIRQGIGIVYQHLNVIPSLSAAENIFAGRLLKAGMVRLDHRSMREKAQELFARLSFPLDVEVPVSRLTAAQQHMVELARVLAGDPRVLILDEVSSKLTPEEMERIYQILTSFREQGRSVIYITHNMEEVFQFADRVTILKDGRSLDTERIEELDRIKLIKLTYSFVLSREELRRQNLELYTMTKYNESIIKNIPVGVVILNDERKIHLINFAARKILGQDADVAGRLFQELIPETELPDGPSVMGAIAARQELSLDAAAWRDGRFLKLAVFPFRDEDFAFLGTIVLMEDVSKDRYIDDYLLRAEKIASTAELAAGVAHEINNPLGIVQNYVELLKLKGLDPDARLKLGKIENEVNRIEKIVGSLLSFSRFDDASFQDVDLVEVLEEVLLLLEHRFAEKGITVRKNISNETVPMRGDESKLKQLFINLLGNSIEAAPAQGGTVEVALSADPRAGSAEVAVMDNGCGIPESLMGRIYDPFFSTKKSRKNAGLGLSISQRIVELHGGMMSCVSQPGKITQFSVRLPMRASTVPGV
jgi:signal transduction histidine kinase/ABC-type branched-subunit amino acid transport system ATPase component